MKKWLDRRSALFLVTFVPLSARAAAPSSADLATAAQAGTTTALAASYSAVMNGATYGMTCDGDASLQSDGNTVDTDALIRMVAAASALPMGAEISLPTGQCEINQTIDIPVSASMRFSGAGIGLTTLQFYTPNGVHTPVGNGLVFSISNNANLTVDDFTINRRLGTNLGAVFVGTAITIAASTTNPQAGNVTTTNLDIYPAFANGQTDAWNTGLLETNITGPLIDNVTISLPGWGNVPDPAGYSCNASGKQIACAIHALPSPANPVATPANLGFGTATGVALQGSGSGHYQIDSVIVGLTVSGGLVGLDLRQFQGAYVTNSKFASVGIGVRADTLGTASELLAVSNSLFTTTTSGVYTNGVGGMELTGNYFWPSDMGTTNLPSWSAIWANNDNNDTVSGNNILGSASAVVPEYGIYHSSNGPNGFPVSITGNTIYSLSSPGSVCMGNNKNMQSINASGNTLNGCATYVADANGGNGYGDNTLQTPDLIDDGNGQLELPENLTVGSWNSTGSLQILNDNQKVFSVASNGTVAAQGSVTSGGAVTAAGTVSGSTLASSGPIIMSGNSSHHAAQEVVGNFYFPGKGNPTTITLNAPNGGFPAFTGGLATIFGELTCSGNNTMMSWHVVGHYGVNGTTLVAKGFAATPENDADSRTLASQLTGNYMITPIANPSAPGLQVAFGSGIFTTFDCTSVLSEMVED